MQPRTISVSGTGGTPAYSNWVGFDSFALPQISIQTDVTGTVNYTIQQTLDDPNSPTNPIAVGSVTWINHPDTNLVAATAAQQSNYGYVPAWARIVLNSGTGTVSATFIQSGSVTK